jgi:hypothetical protein
MKKYIIIAAVIFSTGILTSCIKQNNVKTAVAFFSNPDSAKKDIGSAD